MALCLAESLVECQNFDPVDQLERYTRWYRQGYMSSVGECIGSGSGTGASLELFEKTGVEFPGDNFPDSAGNGGLMRLCPVPLAYYTIPDKAVDLSGVSSRTTHGSILAIDANRFYGMAILEALDSKNHGEIIDKLKNLRENTLALIDYIRLSKR